MLHNVAHGVRNGAASALTAAHLRLSHKMDLCKLAPGFSTADEIPYDIDIHHLIGAFSNYAEVITIIVDVEQVIKDTPFRSRFCTSM